MEFLIHFAHAHLPFRLPELYALARIEKVHIEWCDKEHFDDHTCLLRLRLASAEAAKRLVRKSVLIKSVTAFDQALTSHRAIYEIWAYAEDYDGLTRAVSALPVSISHKYLDRTWRYEVLSPGNSLTSTEQLERILRFDMLPYKSRPIMKNADTVYTLIETYSLDPTLTRHKVPLLGVTFGVLAGEGDRSIMYRYTLKSRHYIGITSLDAEIAAIMANMALLRAGMVAYDPFIGTGGLAIAAAATGAFAFGSDIDGHQIKGTGKKGKDILSNMVQYDLQKHYLGSFMGDVSCLPFRSLDGVFDAIITDPPYGVRAGAKKVGGQRSVTKAKTMERYPCTVQYPMDEVIEDLMTVAARLLKKGGRLVFLMPSISEDGVHFRMDRVPMHRCLQLVAASEQKFNHWSRILITLEKIENWKSEDTAERCVQMNAHPCGHEDFRERYFGRSKTLMLDK